MKRKHVISLRNRILFCSLVMSLAIKQCFPAVKIFSASNVSLAGSDFVCYSKYDWHKHLLACYMVNKQDYRKVVAILILILFLHSCLFFCLFTIPSERALSLEAQQCPLVGKLENNRVTTEENPWDGNAGSKDFL